MIEKKLTDRQLRSAVPSEKEIYLSDGGGLYGRVLKLVSERKCPNCKSDVPVAEMTCPDCGYVWQEKHEQPDKKIVFQYRFKIGGKTGYFHCGTYPQTPLGVARDNRDAARELVLKGIHPAAHEQKERKKLADAEQSERMERTVTQMFETWDRLYIAKHRKDGGALVRNFIESDVLKKIGKMRAKDVKKRHLVTLVIEPILARQKYLKANAVLSLLKQMFKDGAARGTIDTDPTLGLTRAQAGGAEASRTRNLTESEIRALAVALPSAKLPDRLVAALWLLLATGARVGELTGAQWSEFDLEANTWSLPAERSKNGKAHIVHLSEFALRWLAKLAETREGVYVFPGRNPEEPISKKWPSKCVKDRQRKKPLKNRSSQTGALLLEGGLWTPHDLRRTLASRMGDLDIPPHVIEKCLNHSLGGLLAVYQHQEYLPERKAAFETWGVRLASLTTATSEAEATPKPQRKTKRKESGRAAAAA